MRTLLAALLLSASAVTPAVAAQVSYVDQGQVWVSTLDGTQKRAISGPAPVVSAGESRLWTEQGQSDDGWIVATARESGHSGAAAPTYVWDPSGAVASQSTLGYAGAHPSAAVPVQLNLSTGGKWLTYTYSDLRYGYPVSTLYVGTWATNAGSSAEPFDIPNLVGSSLVGSRWIGVNAKAAAADNNIVIEEPGAQGPMSYVGTPWFRASDAVAVDASSDGTRVAVLFQPTYGGPYELALFATQGLGNAVIASCDVPSVGSVHAVSVAPDGSALAWTDDRGLVTTAMPPVGAGSPCPMPSAPVVISATGTYPSIGATTLAVAPAATPSPGTGTPGTPGGPTGSGGSGASSAPPVTFAKSVKASAFAKGVPISVTLKTKGKVTVTAKVGKRTLAKASTTAKTPRRVTLKLKASKTMARQLRRFRKQTLTITVQTPDGSATLTRKLK